MELVGELVAAAVVDARVWEAYGNKANDGVYLVGQPGPALPFVIFRAWKVPVGFVTEEVRLIGPSGRTIHRWGPQVRRMRGAMDLTVELDHVEDGVFDESGTYVASFILDDQIVGRDRLPGVRADVGDEAVEGDRRRIEEVRRDLGGRRAGGPTAHGARVVRLQGRQDLRGVATGGWARGADRAGRARCAGAGRDHSTERSRHVARGVLGGAAHAGGAEWEEAAKLLVDKRKSRGGPPADSIQRWRGSVDIVELTPEPVELARAVVRAHKLPG